MANIYDKAKAVLVTGAIVTGITGAVNDLRSVDITGNKDFTESKGSEITNTVEDVSFNDLEDFTNDLTRNKERESDNESPNDANMEVNGDPPDDMPELSDDEIKDAQDKLSTEETDGGEEIS